MSWQGPTNPATVTTAVRQAGGSILVNGSITVTRATMFANGLITPSPNVVMQLMPGRGGKWRGVPQPIS
jgi:hypothetical protein